MRWWKRRTRPLPTNQLEQFWGQLWDKRKEICYRIATATETCVLEISLDRKLTVYCLVEALAKLGELILDAMVLCELIGESSPVWFEAVPEWWLIDWYGIIVPYWSENMLTPVDLKSWIRSTWSVIADSWVVVNDSFLLALVVTGGSSICTTSYRENNSLPGTIWHRCRHEPHTTLRSLLVHPKDKRDPPKTTDAIYEIPCIIVIYTTYVKQVDNPCNTRLEEHKSEANKVSGTVKLERVEKNHWQQPIGLQSPIM